MSRIRDPITGRFLSREAAFQLAEEMGLLLPRAHKTKMPRWAVPFKRDVDRLRIREEKRAVQEETRLLRAQEREERRWQRIQEQIERSAARAEAREERRLQRVQEQIDRRLERDREKRASQEEAAEAALPVVSDEEEELPPPVKRGHRGELAPPEGFADLQNEESVVVSAMMEMARRIRDGLRSEMVTRHLELKDPLSVQIYKHKNADGSVDVEIRVSPVPRETTARAIYLMMEHFSQNVPNAFITAGIILYHKDDKYRRYKGNLSIVNAYFREANTRTNRAHAFAMARYIDHQMRDKYNEWPERAFIKLHWNPWHLRPQANGRPLLTQKH